MNRIANSRYKLKQLILFIAARLQDAEFFGSTKLNKILYRAEYRAYRELGVKLTTFKYQKNEHGPTLRAFVPVTSEMENEGLIAWEYRELRGGAREDRVRPTNEADMAVFNRPQIRIVEEEIERARAQTAGQVSEEEHTTAAWYACVLGEEIPPELTFVEDPVNIIPFSDGEHTRAAAAIERYRARAAAAQGAYPGA